MQTWLELSRIQPLVSQIMINSIKNDRLSHAYLIQGARGTGKKSLATLLAMTFFCDNRKGAEPCQVCSTCKRIISKNHPDVHWIIPDGASIKNEQIDHLRKEFAYTGLESVKKVYIITDSEKLTVNAANRLLKFLEEPSIDSTALLLTDNRQAILPTIRSRCQILELKSLNEQSFNEKLQNIESTTISAKESRLLTAITNDINEALLIHEAGKIYEYKEIISEFIHILVTRHHERYLFLHQQWLANIKDRLEQEQMLDLLLMALKDIIYRQVGKENKLVFYEKADIDLERAMRQLSQKRLLMMLQAVLEAKQKLKQNVHPTLVLEQLVLQF